MAAISFLIHSTKKGKIGHQSQANLLSAKNNLYDAAAEFAHSRLRQPDTQITKNKRKIEKTRAAEEISIKEILNNSLSSHQTSAEEILN